MVKIIWSLLCSTPTCPLIESYEPGLLALKICDYYIEMVFFGEMKHQDSLPHINL